jgi:hypothetical protein
MQFLAILKAKPGAAVEKIGPLLKPEAAKVWEMVAAGVVRAQHYVRGERGPVGAVLLLEAGGRAEAERHLKQLPLVEHDLLHVEVLPLAPFTGFAALFATA